MMLGMYGWILGVLVLVLLWPLNLFTAHLLWRCRNVFPGAISIADLVYVVCPFYSLCLSSPIRSKK